MSILVRFTPVGVTSQQYGESIRRLKETGEWPPDGLEYHVTYGADGDLRVSEIWDTNEQFAAFGERLMPILADLGINFSAEPEIFEVLNTIKR